MASPTQMHNVLCRSVTIEARYTASSRSSGSHRNWTVSTGPVTAESEERCGRRYMYRMISTGNLSALFTLIFIFMFNICLKFIFMCDIINCARCYKYLWPICYMHVSKKTTLKNLQINYIFGKIRTI
jgi:hypothetical protein